MVREALPDTFTACWFWTPSGSSETRDFQAIG